MHEVLRSPGRPLDAPIRTEMEARLDADFSDVRIHTDRAARASATEVGARAYTSGNHVVIGEEGSDPHLLAHELTHVMQQREGPVAGTDHGSGLRISDPSDRDERAAEANATRVMRSPLPEQGSAAARTGEQGGPHRTTSTPVVQRMPEDEFDRTLFDAAVQQAGSLDSWTGSVWLLRFLRWMNEESGVPGATEQDRIAQLTPEDLDALLTRFEARAAEFQQRESDHATSMGELEAESELERELGLRKEDRSILWGGATLSKNLRQMRGAGRERQKPFLRDFIEGNPPTTPKNMNCWEAVLFAAYRESLIDMDYVEAAIVREDMAKAPAFARRIMDSPAGLASREKEAEVTNEAGRKVKKKVLEFDARHPIPRGYVVIFGEEAQHVALATGATRKNKEKVTQELYGELGHEIYELDTGTNGIAKATIEDIIAINSLYGKRLAWGPLPGRLESYSGELTHRW
ncbi:DUF4157 domain-containing protein [Plantactinospora sp. WMMB782]|uniref:eCIS core domain-containing protein n=1 Tax=Plantactinospora sp. WMMB782 TaxID=3404121 RepID=UPI003B92BF40